MRDPRWVKVEFLGRWMRGVGKCTREKKKMNLLERKKAIKVSADIAMACTRKGSRCWSRALIANAWRDHSSKALTEHMIGSLECQRLTKAFASTSSSSSASWSSLPSSNNNRRINRIRSSRKMLALKLKRSRTIRSRAGGKKLMGVGPRSMPVAIAKRTRRLKRLVPGGELMDDVSLVEETLDYIQSLQAQVEVMRSLLTT